MLKVVADNTIEPIRWVSTGPGIDPFVVDLIHFYCDIILPNREFKVHVSLEKMDADCGALIEPIFYGNAVEFYHLELPKWFFTYYDKDDVIEKIAHECVHLRQYVTGVLIDTYDGMTIFRDELYEFPSNLPTDHPDYSFAPWELEAYAEQNGLFYAYKNRERDDWKKWIEETKERFSC